MSKNVDVAKRRSANCGSFIWSCVGDLDLGIDGLQHSSDYLWDPLACGSAAIDECVEVTTAAMSLSGRRASQHHCECLLYSAMSSHHDDVVLDIYPDCE